VTLPWIAPTDSMQLTQADSSIDRAAGTLKKMIFK
jgi:hypothetical protein